MALYYALFLCGLIACFACVFALNLMQTHNKTKKDYLNTKMFAIKTDVLYKKNSQIQHLQKRLKAFEFTNGNIHAKSELLQALVTHLPEDTYLNGLTIAKKSHTRTKIVIEGISFSKKSLQLLFHKLSEGFSQVDINLLKEQQIDGVSQFEFKMGLLWE